MATELARRGVATTTISQILGHATESGRRATTTEAVYIKPQEVGTLKEAIERLDYSEVLAGVKPYSEVVRRN